MDVLISILKILLIGVITPLGAALVIWELVQAGLGRPLRQPSQTQESQSGEEGT